MFDLITGQAQHLPRHSTVPLVISTSIQGLTLAAILMVPFLFFTEQIPMVPTMMAFVAPPPAAPPPPPPPAPARASRPEKPRPVPTTGSAAPIEAPRAITPEAPLEEGFDEEGVPGGVEGGVPGGVLGGIVGGILDAAPPPPPPPPPPAPRGPVRVGGQIQQPALLHRVEPIYPPIAVAAHVQGTVILEAIVERDGTVLEVTVLRGANRLLDRAAIEAVKQWRYSPVILNGKPERFILTVALSFNLVQKE